MSQPSAAVPNGAKCDFTLSHYRELLRNIADRLSPRTFAAHLSNGHVNQSYVLLRHDIDVSFPAATAIYNIELDMGVRSTYFVRTRSQWYSLQDPAVSAWLRDAVEHGFEIALHEDVTRLEPDPHKVVRMLCEDRELIETITGAPVSGVSTHMPKRSAVPLTSDMVKVAGFSYEAGESAFNLPGTAFFSDANGAWKISCPCKSATPPSRLYLLTHPVWWVTPPDEVAGIVKLIIEGY
jgi:hypothetical protein